MSDNGSPAKHGRPSYPLTSAERRYVSTGDTGGYRESEIDERVQNKVEKLGQRVDHLLSDIQLLAQNGYLGEDLWFDVWVDFIGFGDSGYRPDPDLRAVPEYVETGLPGYEDVSDEEPSHTDIIDACTVGATDWRAHPSSSPEQIGYQVGLMLQRLMFYPEGVDVEQMSFDIAWGLADGFLRGDMPATAVSGDGRRELKEKFIEYQQNRLDREVELDEEREQLLWGELESEGPGGVGGWERARTQMTDVVRDHLSEAGLAIQPIHTHDAWEHLNDEYQGEIAEDGVDAHNVMLHLIDHLVEEPDGIEENPHVSNIPGTIGQFMLFQEQYGPLDEFGPEDVATKDRVLTVVDERDLMEEAKLSAFVESDIEIIKDTHWKNVEAIDVFRQVAEQDGKIRSADIAKEIRRESDKAAVSKLCTDLAGRAFERPILRGDASNWSLTPYGELVAKDEFSSFFGLMGSHLREGEGDDLLERAREQLGIESLEYDGEE